MACMTSATESLRMHASCSAAGSVSLQGVLSSQYLRSCSYLSALFIVMLGDPESEMAPAKSGTDSGAIRWAMILVPPEDYTARGWDRYGDLRWVSGALPACCASAVLCTAAACFPLACAAQCYTKRRCCACPRRNTRLGSPPKCSISRLTQRIASCWSRMAIARDVARVLGREHLQRQEAERGKPGVDGDHNHAVLHAVDEPLDGAVGRRAPSD